MSNIKHKVAVKKAKRAWRLRMISVHPNFETKKWARTSYRLAHPQA